MKININYAIGFSMGYIFLALLSVNQLGEGIKSLKPNEFGDVLAGIFSPLAFSWFVFAVFMQREELSLQREELRLARQEAKGSREALERTGEHAANQAAALLEQSKIMAYENSLNQFYKELQNTCTYLNTHLSKFDISTPGFARIPLLNDSVLELFKLKDFFGFLMKIDNELESKFSNLPAQFSSQIVGSTESDLISVEKRLKSFIETFSVPDHGEDIKAVVNLVAERLKQIRMKSTFDGHI